MEQKRELNVKTQKDDSFCVFYLLNELSNEDEDLWKVSFFPFLPLAYIDYTVYFNKWEKENYSHTPRFVQKRAVEVGRSVFQTELEFSFFIKIFRFQTLMVTITFPRIQG